MEGPDLRVRSRSCDTDGVSRVAAIEPLRVESRQRILGAAADVGRSRLCYGSSPLGP